MEQIHRKGFIFFSIDGVECVKWMTYQNGQWIWNHVSCDLDYELHRISDDSEFRTPFYWGHTGFNVPTGNWKDWIIPIQLFSSLLKETKKAPKELVN